VLPSGRERRRQPVSTPRDLPSTGFAEAGGAARAQPAQRGPGCALLPRWQRGNPGRRGVAHELRAAEHHALTATGEEHRRLLANVHRHSRRPRRREARLKIAGMIAGAALLLMVLTWLGLQGSSSKAVNSQEALRALDDLIASRASLYRDLLSARAGILRNYDPIVCETKTIRAQMTRLHDAAVQSGGSEMIEAADQLASLIDRQEQLTEQFKSDNSLLQNSLAYFGIFSARLSETRQDDLLVQRVSRLATSMLHLTLDTSGSTVFDVQQRLAELSPDNISKREA